jgi:hypothetical protein
VSTRAGLDDLRVAALADPAAALTAWHRWTSGGSRPVVDPPARPWLPLVWWNLRGADLDKRCRALLDQSHKETRSANLRILAGTLPVVRALERAGVRTLLLKGVALSFGTYAHPGLRMFGDADVLVEPQAAPDVRVLLGRLGWRPLRRVAESTQWLRHSQGFTNASGIRFDLHWHALAECCTGDADGGFWRRAEMLRLGALTTRVLTAPDQLLHVCVHGLRWSGPPSELWIADVVMILRRAGATFDWELLVDEARRRGLTFQLGRALDRARQVFPIDVPASVSAALRSTTSSWQDRLEYRAKLGPPTPARLLFLFWRTHARATPQRSIFARAFAFVRVVPALSGSTLPWRR